MLLQCERNIGGRPKQRRGLFTKSKLPILLKLPNPGHAQDWAYLCVSVGRLQCSGSASHTVIRHAALDMHQHKKARWPNTHFFAVRLGLDAATRTSTGGAGPYGIRMPVSLAIVYSTRNAFSRAPLITLPVRAGCKT